MNNKKSNNNQLLMTLLKGRTFIVLVLLVIFFTIVKGTTFLSASTLTMVAKHVALYGILALGMTFVIITGGIDLSVGSVVGLVGMLAGGMIQEGITLKFAGVTLYFSVPVIIITMLVVGCIIGAVNGLIVTKLGVAPFIATLGTMYICRGFANLRSNGATFSDIKGYDGLGNTGFKILGSNIAGIPTGVCTCSRRQREICSSFRYQSRQDQNYRLHDLWLLCGMGWYDQHRTAFRSTSCIW